MARGKFDDRRPGLQGQWRSVVVGEVRIEDWRWQCCLDELPNGESGESDRGRDKKGDIGKMPKGRVPSWTGDGKSEWIFGV